MAGGIGYLIAGEREPAQWVAPARAMFAGREHAEYLDAPAGVFRLAAFADGRLDGALFIGPAQAAPQWDAVRVLFESETLAAADRRVVLSGRRAEGKDTRRPGVRLLRRRPPHHP